MCWALAGMGISSSYKGVLPEHKHSLLLLNVLLIVYSKTQACLLTLLFSCPCIFSAAFPRRCSEERTCPLSCHLCRRPMVVPPPSPLPPPLPSTPSCHFSVRALWFSRHYHSLCSGSSKGLLRQERTGMGRARAGTSSY